MPGSKVPSIAATMSSSRASHTSGVKLTPAESTASSFSSKGAIIYTPSTASEAIRTPTASIASAIPTTSTNLNAVFARLEIEEQRKALRIQPNSTLSQAFGCNSKEVPSLMLTATTDELWGAFCRLNIESRKKSLDGARKVALKKAFEVENQGENGSKAIASYTTSVAASKASSDNLTSAFSKLNVQDQDEALVTAQNKNKSKKAFRKEANARGLDTTGSTLDQDETLLNEDSRPDLAEWQELCRACGVEEIPRSITKCKEILKTKNVALADLSEAIQNGTVAQTFPSLSKLRQYVVEHNKLANKKATKQNKFLKKMLRELFRYRSSAKV